MAHFSQARITCTWQRAFALQTEVTVIYFVVDRISKSARLSTVACPAAGTEQEADGAWCEFKTSEKRLHCSLSVLKEKQNTHHSFRDP